MTPPTTRNEPGSENDLGATDRRSGHPDADPERRCAATGETLPQSRMIRFVLSPDGEVFPDVGRRLPGRGVWVTATRGAVEVAVRKGSFQRGFRQPVRTGEALVERVGDLLAKRAIDQLGLTRKAGAIVSGFDQVRAEIERQRPGLLLEAADGSSDGRNKVISLANSLYGQVEVAGALTSAELGMAFGRDHVVHALIKRGRFAKLWKREYARLAGFRDRPELVWLSERDR